MSYRGAVGIIATSHLTSTDLVLTSGYCLVSFAGSSTVCVGFLWILRFPPTIQKHATRRSGYSNLPLSMHESVNVCVHFALSCPGIPS